MDTLYVNKPGGVIVHTVDGVSEHLKYGAKVPVDRLADHVDPRTFADGQRRTATDDELARAEATRRAAAAENGQVNSSSSPVPGNYSELDEDAAAQLVANLSRYPESQAAVVRHELLYGGGRQKVIDAAGDYAKQSAQIQVGLLELEANPSRPEGAPVTGFGDPTGGGIAADVDRIADRIQKRAARVDLSGPTRTPAPTSGGSESTGDSTASTERTTGNPDGGEAPADYSQFSHKALVGYIEQHNLDVPKNKSADELRSLIAAQEGHQEPQTPPAS